MFVALNERFGVSDLGAASKQHLNRRYSVDEGSKQIRRTDLGTLNELFVLATPLCLFTSGCAETTSFSLTVTIFLLKIHIVCP